MPQRDELQHDQERNQAVDRYLQALDQGDIDAVEAILNQAAYDPKLDHLIHEANAALYTEDGLDTFATSAEAVRVLARQHLHSAFVDETEMAAEIERPLTVGDVVRRLKDDHQISVDDQAAGQSLSSSRVELPEEISIRAISDLARHIGVAASERFWRAFRDTAIMLGLGHSQAQARLAATREQHARHDQIARRQSDNEREEATE